MTQTQTGGCQCGAIRYRFTGTFGMASACHCRMCQKAFGSWGAALVRAPVADFTWMRGMPAEFRSSSIVARGFCKDCGTPLYMREDGHPDYDLAIGTLDNPNVFQCIENQTGIEGKVVWFEGLFTLPAHRTEDERTPADLAKLASRQHPDHDTDKWPPQ